MARFLCYLFYLIVSSFRNPLTRLLGDLSMIEIFFKKLRRKTIWISSFVESLWPYCVWQFLATFCSNIFHFLTRAVCGRIEQTIQGLPPPYRLNQPRMNQGSSTESRQPQKAPTISVNWDCGKSLAHFSLFVYAILLETQFCILFLYSLFFNFLILQIKHQEMSINLLMGLLVFLLQKKVSLRSSMPWLADKKGKTVPGCAKGNSLQDLWVLLNAFLPWQK